MKKLKIKKRMTSFLMLAVMVVSIVGVMPKTIAYADAKYSGTIKHSPHYNHSYTYRDSNGDDVKVTYNLGSSENMNIYLVEFEAKAVDTYRFYFVSYGDFAGTVTTEIDGKTSSQSIKVSRSSCGKYGPIYRSSPMYDLDTSLPRLKYDLGELEKLDSANKLDLCGGENMELHFCAKVCNYEGRYVDDMEIVVECGDGIADGSEDNPIEDKDIGTIILKSHAFIPVKNNSAYPSLPQTDDSTFAYYRFKYQDKTSSGFSISNNKYARTFIQVRVQNQCVLLDPNDRNVVKEFYKHYGEFYQYKNIPTENISDNIFKVSWDDITLKWSDFTEHPNSTNKKLAYRFMIRVICTDSLTVVPDEKSGWHAGGWRSIVFDGSKFVEETNGHVTDDGKWTDDKDDGHNNSSDKTTDVPKSEDEANDSMNDSSSNSSTNFVDKLKQAKNAFDTANEYIKQVLKVPTMLGKLFSFFPDWVLYPFEFAFALIPWIIIYKLLRG